MTRNQTAILLSLGEHSSQLQLTRADGTRFTRDLGFGLEAMTPGPFRRDPPSALELE